MTWRRPPLEGSRKGYSNDIPTKFREELVKTFRVTFAQSVPLRVGVKLEEFDDDEGAESCPFRELVGGLMCLAKNESGAWYSRMHTSMVLQVLALQIREGHQ